MNEEELRGAMDAMPTTKCTIPPAGWVCTRKAGHDGPCAAKRDALKIVITCEAGRFRAELLDANDEQVDVCLASFTTPEYLIGRIRESKTWFENMQDDE